METRIRERLNDLAEDAPAGRTVPPVVLRRARRRVGLTIVVGAVALAAAAFGVTEGLRLAARRVDRPAGQPGTTAFDRVYGWIAVGGRHIAAIDPTDPSRRLLLTNQPDVLDSPLDWSGDGTKLLFARRSSSGPGFEGTNLYVLHADGTEVRLTSDGGVIGGSFSPDGSQVVFARITGVRETEAVDSLYVVPTGGGTPRELETGGEEPAFSYPAWSPDGERVFYFGVFFGRPQDDRPGLAVMNADGTGDGHAVGGLLLDVVEGGTAGLTWSPDGARLAFAGTSETGRSAIYMVRPDGTGLTALVGADDVSYAWPTWSPDGSRIAFVAGERLFSMSADGTGVQELGAVPNAEGRIAWNPVA